MIDPTERWSRGHEEKPDYAGLLTYAGCRYTQEAAELAGVDVAVLGAPTDDLVSDRSGTRFGPRAIRAASCPPGPHLEAKLDPFEELSVVDFGDAPVIPADPVRTHAAIEATIGQVLAAGAIPIVLGGDHSISEPDVRAAAGRARSGWARPLRHPHGHRHRGLRGRDLARDALLPARGAGPPRPKRYVQIGLRGYWPGEAEFAWQAEHGITSFFMHDLRELGIGEVVRRAVDVVGAGPTFLTIDVDVLDPAFAPGTGTPEPGGMTTGDLLWAARTLASKLELVGADVVEVIPTAVGSADITSLAADRIVREILTGIALRHRG